MPTLFITGASGLLGSNLVDALSHEFTVVAGYRDHLPFGPMPALIARLDVTRAAEVESAVSSVRPDVVVHCAAETRVDYCESHPDEALRVNAEGTRHVARAAAAAGAALVYISTDAVFDGDRGSYREEDPTSPVNAYARSKLEGERVALEEGTGALVVRTNIYGWNARRKRSLAEWVLAGLERGDTVRGFSDIRFSPVLVNDLADVLADLIARGCGGVFHAGAHDACSKLDFARLIAGVFGFDAASVRPAQSTEVAFVAPRPRDTSLDVGLVEQTLGRPMPTVADGVRRFRRFRDEGFVARLRAPWAAAEMT